MSTKIMAPRKNKRSDASMAIAQAIINEYNPKNVEDMQDALKDIFGPMFESMLQGEMDTHLGYESNSHAQKAQQTDAMDTQKKLLNLNMETFQYRFHATGNPLLNHRRYQSTQGMSAA